MANIRTRETASGPRYDVKFKFNGRHRMKTFRTFDDAKAYKKKVEGEELAGLVVDPKGGERVFETFADAWLEQRLVRGRPLTPATRQGYQAVLRRHLNPEFGGTRLRQVTPERVRSWYATLSLASRDQAAKSYRVLRAILNTAVSDGLISKNPCTIRGAGIEHAPERPMLPTTTVLELAESIEPRLRCLILLGDLPVCGPVSSSGCSDGTSTCCTARSRSSASPMRSPARDASPRLQSPTPATGASLSPAASWLPWRSISASTWRAHRTLRSSPARQAFHSAELTSRWPGGAPVTPWVCAVSVRMISVITPPRSSPAIPTSRCEN